jgi:hypothetical protein
MSASAEVRLSNLNRDDKAAPVATADLRLRGGMHRRAFLTRPSSDGMPTGDSLELSLVTTLANGDTRLLRKMVSE